MSDPRKHHFVAQLYQRGFARRKGKSFQVRVLNKTSGEGGIRNVRDAFSQRDWNTIKTEDGLRSSASSVSWPSTSTLRRRPPSKRRAGISSP